MTNKENPENFQMIFSCIEYIEISKGFLLNINDEIDEIGYKNNVDLNLNWTKNENEANDTDHFIFRLINEDFLRVYAKEIRIEILQSRLPLRYQLYAER